MKLTTSMVIDCIAGTATVEVSAIVPDNGQDDMDVQLMEAMASALTLMGQATRREQRKIVDGEGS